jgi:hypothetical protein
MCLRWGLGRVMRVQGGDAVRGLLYWGAYVEWCEAELGNGAWGAKTTQDTNHFDNGPQTFVNLSSTLADLCLQDVPGPHSIHQQRITKATWMRTRTRSTTPRSCDGYPAGFQGSITPQETVTEQLVESIEQSPDGHVTSRFRISFAHTRLLMPPCDVQGA